MRQIALFFALLSLGANLPAAPVETGWPLNGGSDRGEHFSPLGEIHAGNAAALGLDWSLDLPAPNGIAATPIVTGGIIYLSGPNSLTWAVDAGTGRVVWSFDPQVKITDANNWTGRVNRGVAVWEGKVFVGTNNDTPRDPRIKGDHSTVYCFDEKTGAGRDYIFRVRENLNDQLFVSSFIEQDFIDKHGLTFPQISDDPGDVFNRFGVSYQPALVIVNTDAADHAMVVEDTLDDDRFRDNPLVVGQPQVRFREEGPAHHLLPVRGARADPAQQRIPLR